MTQAYPLQWPTGWPRARQRQRAQFGTSKVRGNDRWTTRAELTVFEARRRLQDELDRLGAGYPTLSTNIELRLDGQPRSRQVEPGDPGAAIFFRLAGKDIALACDKWDRVADNIAAIAKHIEALRGMDRWGVGSARQAFAGYEALPAPEQWWQVLNVAQGASKAAINSAYRIKAREAHPDAGGSDAAMLRLNAARDAGLKACG